MDVNPAISDAYVISLAEKPTGLTILKENDHLLRRFGQVDFIVLLAGADAINFFREKADEIWAVVDGTIQFELEDQREESPTNGIVDRFMIGADEPKALLVPFGVVCRINSAAGGKLVRICTHEDDTNSGDVFP